MVYSARTAARLSQTELAHRAGTRQSVISAIENGAQIPGGLMLGRIARALGGESSHRPPPLDRSQELPGRSRQ